MDEQDLGASAGGPGSSPTGQAPTGLDASRVDPSRIPAGIFCYESLSPMDARGRMKINGLCPYWERRGEDSAYCHYLNEEDAILLWDQCKICGVNDD